MVQICDDTGRRCFAFDGIVQFSTFTRWSWMLQGVYMVSANLHWRISRPLFGVSFSSALLVTTVAYGVLVPMALFRTHPPHQAGHITVLLSPTSHMMHLTNTAQMLCDVWLSQDRTMRVADLPYSIGWLLLYGLFEWCCYARTGMWHYPFMDYTQPYAWASYSILVGVVSAYWRLGSSVCRAFAGRGKEA